MKAERLLCPYGPAPPKGRRTFRVPRRLRARLVDLQLRRTALNKGTGNLARDARDYYRRSCEIEQGAERITAELRQLAGFSKHASFEFHSGWRYSGPTHATLKAEMRRNKKKKGKEGASTKGGPSYAYLERPVERCHLLDYYLPHVTLNEYLAHERKKHESPKGTP